MIIRTICSLIILIYFNLGHANNGSVTGLELPRYVSLKSNESNLRVGPSKNYPILIKYVVSKYPIKIIQEHEDWRKVVDFQNNTGWLHKSLITGKRTGVIIANKKLKLSIFNIDDGIIVGQVKIGSIVKLNKCKIDWCLISKNKNKGWIEKKYIWGVKKNEEFNVSIFQSFIDLYLKSINYFIEK